MNDTANAADTNTRACERSVRAMQENDGAGMERGVGLKEQVQSGERTKLAAQI